MKVMCINDNWIAPKGESTDFCPKFGDICTVIGIDTIFSREYYSLKEFVGVFLTTHFAPLSDIDEKEFEREYRNEFEKAMLAYLKSMP